MTLGNRIPVFHESRILELADPARVRQLAKAPNVELVRKRKTRQIVQINLVSVSDDSTLVTHKGNPRRYSHDRETEDNPRGCWTLRHLGQKHCPDCGHRLAADWLKCPACSRTTVAGLFQLSVTDNLVAA